jgi:hypothetical protein
LVRGGAGGAGALIGRVRLLPFGSLAVGLALLIALVLIVPTLGRPRRGLRWPWRPSMREETDLYWRRVLRAYLAAERLLRRRGYPARAPDTTPRRHARLLAAGGIVEPAIVALADLADAAAYDPEAITADDAATAHALYRQIRATSPAVRR